MTETNYDKEVSQWWATAIINMQPGTIEFRGTPVQELMGNVSFSEMIWFLVLGRKMAKHERELFDVAMVMSVDHGPQAPSIAISRMAATCGLGINNVMASAVNVLGDNHGGAGEACAELFYSIAKRFQDAEGKQDLPQVVREALDDYQKDHGKFIPGFGHRFHKPTDPRAPRALEILKEYADKNLVSTSFIEIALEVEKQLNKDKDHKQIPLNVDGVSAVIFCSLDVPPPLCRGLFCLARSVGILAHAWEEMSDGKKNKGPMPRKYLPQYRGEAHDS